MKKKLNITLRLSGSEMCCWCCWLILNQHINKFLHLCLILILFITFKGTVHQFYMGGPRSRPYSWAWDDSFNPPPTPFLSGDLFNKKVDHFISSFIRQKICKWTYGSKTDRFHRLHVRNILLGNHAHDGWMLFSLFIILFVHRNGLKVYVVVLAWYL